MFYSENSCEKIPLPVGSSRQGSGELEIVMKKVLFIIFLACVCGMTIGCGSQPKFATAWSANDDPALAGQEAAKKAISQLGDLPLKGLIFTVYYEKKGFTPADPTQYLPDVKAESAAAQAVAEVAGEGVPNIGTRGRGFTNDGPLLKKGVTVLAIGGEQAQCATAVVPILDDREKTGREVALGLKKLGGNLKLIFAVSEMKLSFEDKPNLKHEDLIRGILSNVPRGVVVMGGNSMNDPAAPKAKGLSGAQFVNGKAMDGHVVAMGVAGPLKIYANHTNEFTVCGKPALVTKAKGKWVITLNDSPAAEVYRDVRGMDKNEKFTCDWQHPVGVSVGQGKYQIQMILNWVDKDGKDKDGKKSPLPPGSLRFPTPITAGTKLRVMKGGDDAKAIIESAKNNIEESIAKAKSDDATPVLVLISSCCTRDMRLRAFGTGKSDEIKDGILPAMGKKVFPVFGFYTYGSIGPVMGKFQNSNHAFQQHMFTSAVLAVE